MVDVKMQRYYGKVEMVLDIIYSDNHSNRFIGTTLESIAKWARMEFKEVESLRNLAYYLDSYTITKEMVKDLYDKNENDFYSIYRGMMKDVQDFGHLFTALLARDGDEIAYERIFKILLKDDVQKQEMIKELFMDYAKQLICRIHMVLQEYPYPFDVIDSLWVKDIVSEEQYVRLAERFGLG